VIRPRPRFCRPRRRKHQLDARMEGLAEEGIIALEPNAGTRPPTTQVQDLPRNPGTTELQAGFQEAATSMPSRRPPSLRES
jgi:hypothetical protein